MDICFVILLLMKSVQAAPFERSASFTAIRNFENANVRMIEAMMERPVSRSQMKSFRDEMVGRELNQVVEAVGRDFESELKKIGVDLVPSEEIVRESFQDEFDLSGLPQELAKKYHGLLKPGSTPGEATPGDAPSNVGSDDLVLEKSENSKKGAGSEEALDGSGIEKQVRYGQKSGPRREKDNLGRRPASH